MPGERHFMASDRSPGNPPGNGNRSQNRGNTRDGQNETSTSTPQPTPGQRQSRPRPGRRPQRDGQSLPQRPRTGRSGTGPSAPQQPRGGRSGRTGGSRELGDGCLRVVPLGGMGEIGKSMMAVEYGNDLIVIDAGGKFPEEWERGIDLIIPDIRYVRDRLNKFRGIVITHGHEDHIGALPYVVPQLAERGKVPIFGSPLAMGFAENKLREGRLDEKAEITAVEPGTRVKLGELEVEFINVTHTIPASYSIAVHSPAGTIVNTGDFKFDPTPVMGDPTDVRRLRQLGEEGVLALFSDTTRVESPGRTPSERIVMDTIDRVIREAKGQTIIATFASNISRVLMALKAAEKYNKKVAVAGRSMEQNVRTALELEYLDPPDGLLLPLDQVLRLPADKRVIVVTGSQGEPAAALARIAADEHPKIHLGPGDTALISATPVPGNEETVSETIDNLYRRGATIIASNNEGRVHVSGHAARDELRDMIELLKPKYVVPMHGEYRHMAQYRELAKEAGIPVDHVLMTEIGSLIEFENGKGAVRGRVGAGSVFVDRLGDYEPGKVRLRTREDLISEGLIIITVVVNGESGKLIAGPEFVSKGLSMEALSGPLRQAEQELKRWLERRPEGEPEIGYLVSQAKGITARSLFRKTKQRPLILPIVLEL
jgi:ribonuclease J